jgi:hypothetical protein
VPPQLPSQYHIIIPELYGHSVATLGLYIALPKLAGIHPRRRRHCLCRLLPIRHVCFQLVAPTPSP